MARSDDQPEPGSFYRYSLDIIQAAHPGRDASWHRQQAREVMTEAYEARRRLLPPEDDASDAPVYPPGDSVYLKEDFKAGERAGEAQWRKSTTSKAGQPVQVAQVRGIICIRAGEGSDESDIFLTLPEWRVFAQYLEARSRSTKTVHLRAEARTQLLTELSVDSRRELRESVDSLLALA